MVVEIKQSGWSAEVKPAVVLQPSFTVCISVYLLLTLSG